MYKKRLNKYNNAKCVSLDGIHFDSKREMERYNVLHLLEKSGHISDLRMQVKYELVPSIYETSVVKLKTKEKTITKCIQKAIYYVADFVYVKDGKTIIEDVKGFKTSDYKLKKKMMRYFYKINITEIN